MAATLTEGRKFSLSSVSDKNDISVIFVKLTDSSSRAIEEYRKAKDTKKKPTISFNGNVGVVSIPQKGSDSVRSFDFTVSALQADGSFECIQQSTATGASNLSSLGAMSQKMTIHASDDVYQTTKEKMSLVEEESKKARTKEIKSRGPNSGGRIKKVLKNMPLVHNSMPLNPTPKTSSKLSAKKPTAAVRPVAGQPKVTALGRLAASNAASPNGRVSPYPNKNGSGAVPTAAAAGGSTAALPTPAMNYPLRDRIVHLLAVRNYKRPELLLKLQNDGLHEKDKDLYITILEQVAHLNTRDNSYGLQRSLYPTEVRHDWPLYSDEDRQLLKKKLDLMSLNPRSISPCPSNGSQGSPSRSLKRKRPTIVDDVNPPKKTRHTPSNAKKEAAGSATVSAASLIHNGGIVETAAVQNEISLGREPVDEEFKRVYVPITSYEQRCRYKADFNREYGEHQAIHERVKKKLEHINLLQNQVSGEVEGSPTYEVLRKQIWSEYIRLKGDSTYVSDRQRYEYLYKKLHHIKQMVHVFDSCPSQ